MRFEGLKLSRFVMYNGWLIGFGMACAWMALYPIALGKGFIFFELFRGMFLSDVRLTLWFSFLTLFLGQLVGYECSKTKPKLLEILEKKAVFHLLNGKVIELKYDELSSLEPTKNIYKIFEFTFKDGRKQQISNAIKNPDLALKILKAKIAEANSRQEVS